MTKRVGLRPNDKRQTLSVAHLIMTVVVTARSREDAHHVRLRDSSPVICAFDMSVIELGRFVDRRLVRSAHLKRLENLTSARSDSDSCVVAMRRVRLTDALTTVPLTASISPP